MDPQGIGWQNRVDFSIEPPGAGRASGSPAINRQLENGGITGIIERDRQVHILINCRQEENYR